MSKKYGTERIREKFAIFPTTVHTDSKYYRIWLQPYYIKERWVEGGSNRIRMRGMFQNYYYDGWVLIGEGLTENVETWRKYK